ncbi:hypothetical protein ACFQGE_17925 [Halomicroarcula sp. GCM10025817]|uniref:hypothetical protein n=1 Tax=Halomicroarcula sp. GCM10025817 TaxID=3252672 RepID=UPI00360E8D9C
MHDSRLARFQWSSLPPVRETSSVSRTLLLTAFGEVSAAVVQTGRIVSTFSNTTTVFYPINGHRFTCADEIREILKQSGTDEKTVDEDQVIDYPRTHPTDVDLDEVIAQ